MQLWRKHQKTGSMPELFCAIITEHAPSSWDWFQSDEISAQDCGQPQKIWEQKRVPRSCHWSLDAYLWQLDCCQNRVNQKNNELNGSHDTSRTFFPFLGLEKGLCVQGVVPEFSEHVHTMARTVRHACVFTKSFELAENMIRNSNHKKTKHKTQFSSVRKMLRDDKTKQTRNSFKNTYGISMRRDKLKNHLCFRFHHHHHHHHQFETKKIP